MKDSIRLFVAATLPAALMDKLQEHLLQFEDPALRVLPRQNLHLTLYFIGNVPHKHLSGIKKEVAHIAQQHLPFTLRLERTEPGPNPKRPRLVWARFAPHPAFEALSQELTEALSGQPATAQKPIPHVTLARFRKDQKPPKELPSIEPEGPLELPVQEIALWKSTLGSPHPTYAVLQSYTLG